MLAPTSEELVTTHASTMIRSYRDLPKILYHFQAQGARRAASARRRPALA